MIRQFILIIILLNSAISVAQDKDLALQNSNDYVFEGNELVEDEFVLAEMEYRKALNEKPDNSIAAYNLGNAYYRNNMFSEAYLRHQEALKSATTKAERHKVFHNMGNTLMQNKQCKEAVEAFKNALRNNPTDDETRYNLALAKDCAEDQGGGGGDDENQDQDQDQDQQDNQDNKEEGDQNEDKKDQGEEDKGDEKEDEDGQPKDEEKEQGQGEEDKKDEIPKPQPGQLSPQQIKNLLDAMNDQEQKVQEKINAQKAKGVKVQNDKDW